MNKYAILFLLLCWPAIFAWSQDNNQYYRDAEESFEQGDYENAERKYKAWEKLSTKTAILELRLVRECIAIKQEADYYYSQKNLDKACEKYKELRRLNENDKCALKRMNECCYRPPETTLEVTTELAFFVAYGGKTSIDISTNASQWSVSGKIPWCELTQESASSLTLTCEPNTVNSLRTGYFNILAGNKQRKIVVEQAVTKNPVEAGEWFFTKENYRIAKEFYSLGAEQGNAEAQFRLGKMYAKGSGVVKDWDKAKRYFQSSASQGNAAGENGLGYIYEMEDKNYKEAAKWYRKSAEKGYARAQYNLGLLYEFGYGVMPDEKEAWKWYAKSAAQGFPEAIERMKIIK